MINFIIIIIISLRLTLKPLAHLHYYEILTMPMHIF